MPTVSSKELCTSKLVKRAGLMQCPYITKEKEKPKTNGHTRKLLEVIDVNYLNCGDSNTNLH